MDKQILEEFDKKLEKMCRILMIRGYEQGKKQSKNPHNYTLDTDMAEKEWKHIKDFISKALETQRAEIEKKNREMYATDVPKILDKQRGHFGKALKEQRVEIKQKLEKARDSSFHILPQTYKGYANKYQNLLGLVEDIIKKL